MSDPLLTIPEVVAEVGLSRATIYRRVASGDFPRPIQLSPRRVAWRESWIEAWKASRPLTLPAAERK